MSIKVLLLLYRPSRDVLFCFWTLWSCSGVAVPPSVLLFFRGEKTISLDHFSASKHDHLMRANGFCSDPLVWIAFPHSFLFQALDFLQSQPPAVPPGLTAQASGAGALTPTALPLKFMGPSPPQDAASVPVTDRISVPMFLPMSRFSASVRAGGQEGCWWELRVTSSSGLACEKMAARFPVWAGPLK